MNSELDIAVVGLAGRFPGAETVEAFWRNLCAGAESVEFFGEEELLQAGVRKCVLRRPEYVPAQAVLDRFDHFDAEFFGFRPRQAALLDPQHRIFLECAWEAFENAGYVPERVSGHVGVYAGSSTNGYSFHLFPGKAQLESGEDLASFLALDKDFLATRVSYKLNLTGPSVAVQTACSTSLVAVHLACQGLLNGECGMALAGGVAINVPHKVGYLYQKDGIASPDGHCRPFDSKAQGTVLGSGAGVVLLKRLKDALADGDSIVAVVKGSAINNDGSDKVGFTAPSVDGQARVVRDAHAVSGIKAETISYVEAHGTGTPMGDPIEVAALTKAFGVHPRSAQCVLGSLKSNVGHLDAAAGVTGLIKVCLALSRRKIPGTVHFDTPNPAIDWSETPFLVSGATMPWEESAELPRRAGVSSFGLGGTNAHAVVEEAPRREEKPHQSKVELVVLSARSERGLRLLCERMAEHLEANPSLNLADLAHTLRVGRRGFTFRRACVATSIRQLRDQLGELPSTTREPDDKSSVAFMFPGQGAQILGLGHQVYEAEPTFRQDLDACSEQLLPILGFDIREVLFPSAEASEEAGTRLNRTSVTQPALFVLEFCLARLWMSWGIQPSALLGHSVGEFVAACISGTLLLKDALALVATRGRLMEATEPGRMIVVAASEEEVADLLSSELALAAVNSPDQCVLSGTEATIADCERQLAGRKILARRLPTERAFHSHLMDGVLLAFRALLEKVSLQAPTIPWVSNVTGTWITESEAQDPEYWVRHLRSTVRFADGAATLSSEPNICLLEVGPGRTLTSLVRRSAAQHSEASLARSVFASLNPSSASESEQDQERHALLEAVAGLWVAGIKLDFTKLYSGDSARRVQLPTTPFESKRYWIEASAVDPSSELSTMSEGDTSPKYYAPTWARHNRVSSCATLGQLGQRWLILDDSEAGSHWLIEELLRAGAEVCRTEAGIGPLGEIDDLLGEAHQGRPVTHAVHILAGGGRNSEPGQRALLPQVNALLRTVALARHVGKQGDPVILLVVGPPVSDVTGAESLHPEFAPFLGLCRSIPREYPAISCRFVDIEPADGEFRRCLLDCLATELEAPAGDAVVAYRGRYRWLPGVAALKAPSTESLGTRLRDRGVYLITGGLGGLGVRLALYLASTVRARLVLVQRHLPTPDVLEQQIDVLKEAGGEVFCLQADVSDAETVARAIDAAVEEFGEIHGVIHSAGVANGGLLKHLSSDSVEEEFAAKVCGTVHLEQALGARELDFLVLCSSLTALSGGVAQAGYAAANCYLDGYAEYVHELKLGHVISVNFDRWVGVGMAANAEAQLSRLGLAHLARVGLTQDAEIEVFERIFSDESHHRLIVSARALSGLPNDDLDVAFEAHALQGTGATGDASDGQVEQGMLALWASALGIEDIGYDSNFYDLGGESLLALQIVNRAREKYGVELSLQDFFENPTPKGLATQVLRRITQRSEKSETSQREPELVARPRRSTRLPSSGEGTGQ